MDYQIRNISREISPLSANDCFSISRTEKEELNIPLHSHEDLELIFIKNGSGARRTVGDNVEEIGEIELLLVGPDLPHGWSTHQCSTKKIQEWIIQFPHDLFGEKFLKKNQMSPLRTLMERAQKGIHFSKDTAKYVEPRLEKLVTINGFDTLIELMSILNELANTRNSRTLSTTSFFNKKTDKTANHMEKVFDFMQTHYNKNIALGDLAKLVGMPEVSFCRLFKKNTGKTFKETLNEIRISQAEKLLMGTGKPIEEISFHCGFNNLSNFNRRFKIKNNCTPTQYRERYSGSRIFI